MCCYVLMCGDVMIDWKLTSISFFSLFCCAAVLGPWYGPCACNNYFIPSPHLPRLIHGSQRREIISNITSSTKHRATLSCWDMVHSSPTASTISPMICFSTSRTSRTPAWYRRSKDSFCPCTTWNTTSLKKWRRWVIHNVLVLRIIMSSVIHSMPCLPSRLCSQSPHYNVLLSVKHCHNFHKHTQCTLYRLQFSSVFYNPQNTICNMDIVT